MKLLLFLLLISSTGWSSEDEEDFDEDEEWSYSGSNDVTYRDLTVTCYSGCADPEEDPHLSDINFLLSAWLWHPIIPKKYAANNMDYAKEAFNLTPWPKKHPLFDLENLCKERENEWDEDFPTHSSFCDLAASLRTGIEIELAKCLASIEASESSLQRMEQLFAENPSLFIRFYDYDERLFEVYHYGDFLNTRLEVAIRDERNRVSRLHENYEEMQEFSLYAEKVFQTVDALFKKMFLWCLENHQLEGVAFHKALSHFLAQDYDRALLSLRTLIDFSEERHFDNAILSRLHFASGQLQSEALLYSEAILSLTEAIAKDPQYKEAYFERAAAYFELGDFDASIQDYLASGKRVDSISNSDKSLLDFAMGMTQGASQGLGEAVKNFFPTLAASLSGIGNFLWTTISHPIDTPKEYAILVHQFFQDLSKSNLADCLTPKARKLLEKWKSMSSAEQGRTAGYLLGKHGTDLALGVGLVKGGTYLNYYMKIKQMEKLCALETLTRSKAQQEALITAATQWKAQRTSWFAKVELEIDKQNKHIRKAHNFNKTGSEWTHLDPEGKIKQLAGKGQKVTGVAGEPGYKERVDCGEVIGLYRTKKDLGLGTPTTMATIHYSKKGAHIVPAKQKNP